MKKGILVINDPALYVSIFKAFPDWHVVVAKITDLVKFYPIPTVLDDRTVEI